MFGRFIFVAAAAVLLCSSLGQAQTTARVSGVLTDGTGAVLPRVQVAVMNVTTGIPRTLATDEKGRFVAAQLAPGPYQITATMAGFDTLVRTGITLEVGQEGELSLAMKGGAVSEQVTVTGEAPLVNTSGSAVAGTVEEKRIVELPLNGRDFTQLALVQPGMYLARKSDTVGTKGFGTRISVAGSRVEQTAWLLDGTNIRGASAFGVPGSAAGLVLGVDAVREFQVLTSNFSAEFGFTSGGVVNMVTKSGTNQFHGTAYEFLRNSVLDARNFFDYPNKAAFKRNQFGASVGGPIKKERAFFFGNYEGLRQRLGVTRISQVPDANVHRGLVPDRSGVLQSIPIAASTRPYLELYPLPNGQPVLANGVPTGISQLLKAASQPTNENYFVTRVDYRLDDKQNLFSRFTFDQGDSINPDTLPITSTNVRTRTRYSTVQHQFIVTPQFLMMSRVAYNRSVLASTMLLHDNFSSNVFIFNPKLPPTIGFPGVSSIAPNLQNIFSNTTNLYQFAEDMVYTRGSHSMKFGADFEKMGMNFDGGSRDFGAFDWKSIADFLQDSINGLNTFTVGAPGSSAFRTTRQRFLGLYLNDDWKVRSRLSVNLGLRYEPYSIPTEKWGRLATIRDWRTTTQMQTDIPFFHNPSKKYLSPRVGFAWDPRGTGKTAVRGGFGVFYLPATLGWWRTQTYRNPPFYALINTVPPNLAGAAAFVNRIGPTILTTRTNSATFVQLPNWNIRSSYEMKLNLTVERDLGWDTRLAAGYLGGRGVGLWRLSSANAAPPILVNGRPFVAAGTPRPNPNLSSGAMNFSDAQSFYNSMQIEIKKRFSHGFQFQASYTWSKNMDDSTTGGVATDYSEGDSSQPYNPKGDRGLSALHVGQNFVFNTLYSIPSPWSSGLGSYLLGGWQISGIFSAASGIPFTVNVSGFNAPDLARSSGRQRPDLAPGRDPSDIVLGSPSRYFDTAAFVLPPAGFYGNLGRNVTFGPGLTNVDLSVLKNFRLHWNEGSRLEFHADLFNISNHPNFSEPASVVLNASNGRPVAGAGLITTTTTNSRQIQFGLKLVF